MQIAVKFALLLFFRLQLQAAAPLSPAEIESHVRDFHSPPPLPLFYSEGGGGKMEDEEGQRGHLKKICRDEEELS